MKTPEQMASEWYWANLTEESPVVMLTNPVKHPPCPRKAFVAGYKAGENDMQTQLAVGEDVVRNLLNAPQWISVEQRLPERSQKVLALGEDQTVLLLKLRETYDKDLFGNWEYVSGFDQDVNGYLVIDVSHWMPLPEPPKDAKE